MKTAVALIASILAVVVAVFVVAQKKEGFTADGWVLNKPSEWFNKAHYNPNDWIVTYSPDQLSKPECMHYRGNNQDLNYLSSAYRFWRM